jgi:hypothetical protein
MAFYTSKPVEVEAFRYDGNLDKIKASCPGLTIHHRSDNNTLAYMYDEVDLQNVLVRTGDYVVKMNGYYTHMTGTVFESKYEMVLRRNRQERTTTHER